MKLKHTTLTSFLLAVTLSSQAMAVIWNPARCETSGDSLNEQEAIARRAWAWKCFPAFRGQIKANEKITDGTVTREGYPTLAFVDDNGNPSNPSNWFAPKDQNAACDYPKGYTIVNHCVSGCYTPEQMLWFKDGYTAIGDAMSQNFQEIISLTSTSDLNSLQFKVSPIDYFVTDLVEGWQTILTIQTLLGGSIRVTENHPLVDSEGQMRSADSLQIGESLVTAHGEFDRIISIVPEQYYGKVYNVDVKQHNLVEKILVAQGFLNGSVHYQNQKITDLNRVILRTNLITDHLVR